MFRIVEVDKCWIRLLCFTSTRMDFRVTIDPTVLTCVSKPGSVERRRQRTAESLSLSKAVHISLCLITIQASLPSKSLVLEIGASWRSRAFTGEGS